MKTIQISNESYEFLMNLSKELNEQDHRGTAMPYFFQVQTMHQIAVPEGNGVEAWFYDGSIIKTEEEIREVIEEHTGLVACDILDEDEAEKILEEIGYSKVNYDYEPRYENAFLTSKACDEHIKANRHNLSSPLNYLSHARRNPELEKLMEIICGLTGGTLHI